MAYKQGSMGLAILAALGVFVLVDMIVGFALANGASAYALFANPLGSGFSGIIGAPLYGAPVYADAVRLILDIMIPVVCGILAGIIARGSAGRGFIAGFSGVVIASLMMFLVSVLVSYAIGFSMFGAGLNTATMITLLLGLLIVPIILGIFGGIGGALMSAILASPDTSTPQSQSPVTTTFIQATPPAAPIIVGGSSYGPPAQQAQPTGAEAKVICPACKTQNDSSSTFCQSCGTRLKS